MDIYGYLFICMYNSYSAVTLDTLVSTYTRYQGCADPQALNNSDDHYTNIIWDIMIVSITFGNILVFITLVSSSILPCQTQTQIVLPTSSMSLFPCCISMRPSFCSHSGGGGSCKEGDGPSFQLPVLKPERVGTKPLQVCSWKVLKRVCCSKGKAVQPLQYLPTIRLHRGLQSPLYSKIRKARD